MKRRRRGEEQVPRLGIEVDGDVVVAVTVVGEDVAACRRGAGATLADRMADVLSWGGPNTRVTVSLADPGVTTTPVLATDRMLDRGDFEAAAHAATQTHEAAVSVAGVFDVSRLRTGQSAPAAVLTAPSALVAEIHRALGSDTARVMAAPATLGPLEGASLALRRCSAELTLTAGGQPRRSKYLPAGGLDALDARLGRGDNVGTTRLEAAMTARSAEHWRRDPEAMDELSRYLTLVATQATAALQEWALAGEPRATSLYVFGPGARSDLVSAALGAAGLTDAGNPLQDRLTALDPAARPAAIGAYLAAIGYDPQAPHRAFVNPMALRKAVADLARRRRLARARTLSIAAGLLAASLAVPFARAALAERAATDHLAQATQSASRSGVDLERVRVLSAGPFTDPRATAELVAVAAAHGQITELEAGPDQASLDVLLPEAAAGDLAAALGALGWDESRLEWAAGTAHAELVGAP